MPRRHERFSHGQASSMLGACRCTCQPESAVGAWQKLSSLGAEEVETSPARGRQQHLVPCGKARNHCRTHRKAIDIERHQSPFIEFGCEPWCAEMNAISQPGNDRLF